MIGARKGSQNELFVKNRWTEFLAGLLLVGAIAASSACSADGAVAPTVNNGVDAGDDVSIVNNVNNVSNSNNSNNANNLNNGADVGVDMGVDMEPAPKISIPTTFVPTNGGGTSTSAEHELTISVGTPQPHGQAENAQHRLLIGPIIPTGEN